MYTTRKNNNLATAKKPANFSEREMETIMALLAVNGDQLEESPRPPPPPPPSWPFLFSRPLFELDEDAVDSALSAEVGKIMI